MGPQPKDWSYRIPRSARRAALRSALSLRIKESHLVVLDEFAIESPKTKAVVELLKAFDVASVLLVDVKNDQLSRSVRNLSDSKFVAAEGITVYDILDHEYLILTQAAVEGVVDKAKKARAS